MAQVDEIINDIMASPRFANSRVFSDRVYQDEPIIRRGTQMKSYLPQRYRDMKALARTFEPTDGASFYQDARFVKRPSGYTVISGNRLFFEQAHFMADWEDDFPYSGTFEHFYPTYSQMKDDELRGYFTWRTKVRSGRVEETSLSFAFVYCYELLNGVGGETPLDCFRTLKQFWFDYRTFAPEMNRYLKYWLRDFAVYHNLPSEELHDVIDTSWEEATIVLRKAERQVLAGKEIDAAEVFHALCVAGSYNASQSKFVAENRADVQQVAGRVFELLVQHCAKRRKLGLADSWFGTSRATPHVMFDLAVFYKAAPHADCLYRINEAHAYSCRGGRWFALRNYSKAGRNAEVHDLVQSIDRMMREAYGFDRPLKKREVSKYMERFIAECIEQVQQQKRDEEARRVDIDFAALSGIRSRAAQTRESLLIDEERGAGIGFVVGDEPVKDGVTAEVVEAAADSAASEPAAVEGESACADNAFAEAASVAAAANPVAGNPFGLNEEEADMLRALLAGDAAPAEVDMLVDSINEKLFDLLGDTALEFGAAGPQIVEDYREDLEGVLS